MEIKNIMYIFISVLVISLILIPITNATANSLQDEIIEEQSLQGFNTVTLVNNDTVYYPMVNINFALNHLSYNLTKADRATYVTETIEQFNGEVKTFGDSVVMEITLAQSFNVLYSCVIVTTGNTYSIFYKEVVDNVLTNAFLLKSDINSLNIDIMGISTQTGGVSITIYTDGTNTVTYSRTGVSSINLWKPSNNPTMYLTSSVTSPVLSNDGTVPKIENAVTTMYVNYNGLVYSYFSMVGVTGTSGFSVGSTDDIKNLLNSSFDNKFINTVTDSEIVEIIIYTDTVESNLVRIIPILIIISVIVMIGGVILRDR